MSGSKNKPLFPGVLAVSLLIFLALGSVYGAHAGASSPFNSVSISLPINQQININAPYSSNFTILSVIGQGYDLQTTREYNSNVLTFTPTNNTQFRVIVNVSSSGSNYAYVTKEASPIFAPACGSNNCNFTGQGNIIVELDVNATQETAQGGSWNPLFGMLPFRLQGFSISFDNVIETIAGIGFLFLGLGIAFRSKITYLGVAILFIVGAIMFGLLVPFGMIGLYLLGFAVINLVWKYKTWKGKR
jgi:hypothetical protein